MFVVAVLLCGYSRCFKILLLLGKKKQNKKKTSIESSLLLLHTIIPRFPPPPPHPQFSLSDINLSHHGDWPLGQGICVNKHHRRPHPPLFLLPAVTERLARRHVNFIPVTVSSESVHLWRSKLRNTYCTTPPGFAFRNCQRGKVECFFFFFSSSPSLPQRPFLNRLSPG